MVGMAKLRNSPLPGYSLSTTECCLSEDKAQTVGLEALAGLHAQLRRKARESVSSVVSGHDCLLPFVVSAVRLLV